MLTLTQLTITITTLAVLAITTLAVIYGPSLKNREKVISSHRFPDKTYDLRTEEARAQIRRGGLF